MLFSNDGGGDGGDGPSVLMHCWLELVLWLRELSADYHCDDSYYCGGSTFQLTGMVEKKHRGKKCGRYRWINQLFVQRKK